MSRRRSRVAKCYTELAAAPGTLMHDGQVIRLATHVWRECAYRHITDKSQERDLSGVLCTAWLVHSRPTTSATTSSTTSEAAPPPRPNLRIRRLWLVNQHNCSVHTSRAVALGPKAGVVHAWGPRETEPEPGDRSQGHHSDPHAGGGAGSSAAVSAVSQPCYAGPQYRTLRQGPCWELCTVCDVTAQLEDSVTGEDLGLLKSEDKVVSAEVVLNWRDLAGVLLHLLVLMLHLITIHPIQVLAAAAARHAQIAHAATSRLAVWITAGCQEAAAKVLAARWADGGRAKSALGWGGRRQRIMRESEKRGAGAVGGSAGLLFMSGGTVQGSESSKTRASGEGGGSSTGTSSSKHGVRDLCGDGGERSAGDTGSVDGVDKHTASLPTAAFKHSAGQRRGSLGQPADRQQVAGQAFGTDVGGGGGGVRDGNGNSDSNSKGRRAAAPCPACGTSGPCSTVSGLHSSSSSDEVSGGEESVSDSRSGSGSGSSMQLPTGAACSGHPACSSDAALSDSSSTGRSLSVRGRGITNCTHSSDCSSCAATSSSEQPAGEIILSTNCSLCASSSPCPSLQSAGREAVLATREVASSALSSPSLPLTAQTHRPVTLPTSSAPPHLPHLTVLSSAQPSAPGAHHSPASTPPYTLASVAPPPSVQLPAWSGHVFAGRGTMQSAVFCTAVLMGLAAAVLATGVATVLVDLLQSVRSLT